MLPEGCAYLQLDGLYGLARRLNFECVPCVVGWEFHKNGNHPMYVLFLLNCCKGKYKAKIETVFEVEFPFSTDVISFLDGGK